MERIIIFSLLIVVSETHVLQSPFSIDSSAVVEKDSLRVFKATTASYNSIKNKDELNKISLCTYDYRGLRINKGCIAESEEPLICQKGELVLKTFDDGSEMCCCNYSQLDAKKILK